MTRNVDASGQPLRDRRALRALARADALRRTVRRRLGVGAPLVPAGVGLGLVIALGFGNAPLGFDAWWMAWMQSIRDGALLGFGFAMNWIGGGWFGAIALPLCVAVLLLLFRGRWAALFFVTCELASAGVVQLLKHIFGRARPEEILVAADAGSFPSGHVANAATLAIALLILFPRVWVAVAGVIWVVLMAFSRTLVGAHWASDTMGGALIGVGIGMLVGAAFAVPLARERLARLAP